MRIFLIIVLACGISGCAARTEPHYEYMRRIEATIRARYDLDAVRAFLMRTVAAHPEVEGVTLSSKLGRGWVVERMDPPSRMRSGDWVLYDPQQGDDEFELYSDAGQGRQVSIRAKRESRSQYTVVAITIDELLYLSPSTELWQERDGCLAQASRHRLAKSNVPNQSMQRTRLLSPFSGAELVRRVADQ